MREIIINALRLKYKGVMAEAQANIEIYLENPAGIGEHPEVLAAIDSELHKLAEARDKLLEVNEL
jgi:hypothetical protein|tara:strand:+ start:88 stop:282 length:195 start_codon:yes stop_codon:yes gene_type:complete